MASLRRSSTRSSAARWQVKEKEAAAAARRAEEDKQAAIAHAKERASEEALTRMSIARRAAEADKAEELWRGEHKSSGCMKALTCRGLHTRPTAARSYRGGCRVGGRIRGRLDGRARRHPCHRRRSDGQASTSRSTRSRAHELSRWQTHDTPHRRSRAGRSVSSAVTFAETKGGDTSAGLPRLRRQSCHLSRMERSPHGPRHRITTCSPDSVQCRAIRSIHDTERRLSSRDSSRTRTGSHARLLDCVCCIILQNSLD